MFGWLLRRLGQVVPTLLILSLLVFGLQQLMPGDPALIMAGEERGDPEVLAQIRAELMLDRPVWEQYLAGDPEAEALFNGVTEIRVGEGATLRFVCGQDLSDSSWVFATQRAEVARDASLDWLALGFGSARGKVRMETKLAGRGSSAKVTGAYAGLGTQHLDYDTTQEHAAPDTVHSQCRESRSHAQKEKQPAISASAAAA